MFIILLTVKIYDTTTRSINYITKTQISKYLTLYKLYNDKLELHNDNFF